MKIDRVVMYKPPLPRKPDDRSELLYRNLFKLDVRYDKCLGVSMDTGHECPGKSIA